MKQGAYLINNSRGTVVDLEALAAALQDGHLRGRGHRRLPCRAGLEQRARSSRRCRGSTNVILTPHIGGSTEEAQERIGARSREKLVEYSDVGTTIGAVNFPQVQLPPRPTGTRYIHVHRNVPGMLGRLNNVFSQRGLNITAQYLQTDGEIGYVVIEAEGSPEHSRDTLHEIRALDGTIRARLLYARG